MNCIESQYHAIDTKSAVMIVTELKTSQNSRGNEHETTTATAWTWTTKTAQTNMWIQRCNYGKH